MFAEKIIQWYTDQGRDLPWRHTNDPYHIWLSEIILQQTRIEQGRSYYAHFIETYPSVGDLAAASEQQVLRSWQGLGYYSRARNLHAAARHIAYDLGGQFPDTYEGILALKGVGRYTAAAIASFAYRLPYPVIDGNVYRLIARLYGIFTPIASDSAYREFETLLLRLIDRERPDLFNQAMMDFGSLHCRPRNPDCGHCIFRDECVALRQGQVEQLPVRGRKATVTERHFYYFDIRWQEEGEELLLLQRRGEGDIWQGLYELPLLETDRPIPPRSLPRRLRDTLMEWCGDAPAEITYGPKLQHQLTHRTIQAQFIQAKYSRRPAKIPQKTNPTTLGEIKTMPISRLIDKYLSKL